MHLGYKKSALWHTHTCARHILSFPLEKEELVVGQFDRIYFFCVVYLFKRTRGKRVIIQLNGFLIYPAQGKPLPCHKWCRV